MSKVYSTEHDVQVLVFESSPSSSGELNLKVNNPDQYVLWPDDDVSDALMNQHLKLVRLQYRPVSGGEWITAKDEASNETDKKFNLLCADSRTEGCKFDWVINNQYEKLLSGFKDNMYELRLKNFCFGGPSLADPSVHEYVGDQRLTLTVDTKLPMVTRVETSMPPLPSLTKISIATPRWWRSRCVRMRRIRWHGDQCANRRSASRHV